MLYLIGLGLNKEGISAEGLEVISKCKSENIYLEGYTVDFPYDVRDLENVLGKKIQVLERAGVESEFLVKEARRKSVCLMVYGSPLFATTHTTILLDCKKSRIKVKVIYAASVFDALGKTGLQLYKFGKITSMPAWKRHYEPDSYLEIVKQNRSINAHSLILIDIGLPIEDAIKQLEESAKRRKIEIHDLVVCSNMGEQKEEIFYGKISKLKKKIKKIKSPYCFIIPEGEHFLEKKLVESFSI